MNPRLGPPKPATASGPDELERLFQMTARTVEGTSLEARLDRPSGKVHIINRSTGNVVHAFGVNEVKP